MKPPVKEIQKVIDFYKRYHPEMNVTIPTLKHIKKDLELMKKYKT